MKQMIAMAPDHMREPPGLKRKRAFLDGSQWWPRERMLRYRLEQLNRILRFAAERVPFYRERTPRTRLPLGDIRELAEWPIIDRELVASSPSMFLAEGLPTWRRRSGSTSGRSGRPLTVFWDWPSAVWWEKAFVARAFSWAGLSPGFRRAVLRGNLIHGPSGIETREAQIIPHRNTLVLSVYQLSSQNVDRYLDRMCRFRVEALQAYPSAALKLAMLAGDSAHELPDLKAILTSSEQLTPSARETIESNLGAPVYDLYGHAERAVGAAQCERRQGYHLFEEYGILEVLSQDGTPVGPGHEGELVATGFLNRAMPFIRYRTGDFGTLSDEPCPCGRSQTILSGISGRHSEYVVDGRGRHVSIRLGLGSELQEIAQMRFVQTRPGFVDLLYVANQDVSDAEDLERRLIGAIGRRLGKKIHVEARRVEELPLGPDGRAFLVDQQIERGVSR